jgi:PLP dependent protein
MERFFAGDMIPSAKLAELTRKADASGARVVAVSKTRSAAEILELYQQGQRLFGENRVQEMQAKQPELPADIDWHLIGHLQRNKVRFIAPWVAMIHSVDSERLLAEIDRQAEQCGRVIPVLLQVHIADEESKFGWSADELRAWCRTGSPRERFAHVAFSGLMGMATFTENQEQIRREFRGLRALRDELQATCFAESPEFRELSMGMSGDWEIALEEGATLIRVGSLLFGERAG